MQESIVAALVRPEPERNAGDLLAERAALTPDKVLFSVPGPGGWRDVTCAQFEAQVVALAKGFAAAGIGPGDKIGLMCTTRYEWILIDFAVWYAGAILVPVYETSAPAQIYRELGDSAATAMIVETAEHFARFDEVHPDLPLIGSVWQLGLGDLDKLVDRGRLVPDEEIERRRHLAVGDDVATLIYTSGSTGEPKGCVITHSNLVELTKNTALAMSDVVGTPGASTLLFVTAAHVFARFVAVLCVYAGVRVGHQADTSRLLPALASFRPTFLLAVPRVFEKVYNSAEQKAESGGRGGVFRRAADTAVEYSTAREAGGPMPLGLRLRFRLFDLLVYRRLRAALGGRARYAVSGSAPLSERLARFFDALGLTVLEGYGLTETTAPATVSPAGRVKIGTVGTPLPGTGVRIADDGEILLRGVNIFRGYWNDPESTTRSFDGEWFKTGDIGSLDEDGYLSVTGRKKEIIVTAGGKNVAPAGLESVIGANPLVDQVLVVGDRRPFVAALVTLDAEMLPLWLNDHREDPGMSLAQAAVNPAVRAEIQRAVDAANSRVSRAESVRKFVVLDTQWTQESGHLTPKMSVKRDVVLHDFQATLDGLYSA
ncbi:MAG TPA: AMP-dependent synthetase/ligase [Microbacteriaceae bacterium]|nr:AMP-dependent synthetase/ligase [Microbacteriaceae bacterium]